MKKNPEIIELTEYFSNEDYEIIICKARTYELIQANEIAPFTSSFVQLSNSSLLISQLIDESIDFRVFQYTVSRRFVSIDFKIIPAPKSKDVSIVIIFPGDSAKLKALNKVNHRIPCACLSAEYTGKIIKLSLDREKLTQADIGSHTVQAFARDQTVYSVDLTILKVKGDFSAQGILKFPELT